MAKKTSSATQKQQSKSAKNSAMEAPWLRLGLIVLAITAACYLPTLNHGFVNWDDTVNITENPNLQLVGKGQPWSTTLSNIFHPIRGHVIGNYNPLPILMFAVGKSLNDGEFSPTLIHFTNLLLHLLTVFFVMKLLWSMGIGRWGVALGGLLFGLHPMRVESVAWATERKDVLFALFFFWALNYYLKWLKMGENEQAKRKTYAIMVVLALLSCLSKVQAVALPLSMLALDFWVRRSWSLKLLWEKTPFWLLSIAFGLLNLHTLSLQGSTNDAVLNFNFLDRLCIGAYSYCTYLYKLLLPYPMSPLYSYPQQLPWIVYAAPLGVAAVAAGFVWALLKGKRIWVFGLLFFTVNIMFVLQIFAAGQGFLADRFTYVAYFGLFAIAAYYLDAFSRRENSTRIIQTVLGALAIVYGAWTIQQASIWKDGETLWGHVMKLQEGKTELSVLPYLNRGKYLMTTKGDFEAALKDYSRAVQLKPDNPEPLKSRGKAYFMMAGMEKNKNQMASLLELAVKDYTEALTKPDLNDQSKSDAYASRAAAYGMAGMYEQCIADATQSIKLDPKNKSGYANRSNAYLNTGQFEYALNDYAEYLNIDPNSAEFWYERGMLQRTLTRYLEAEKSLNNAIRLNPNLGLAYLERARARTALGNPASITDYQKAIQLGVRLEPIDQQMMELKRGK